jgi:hypothetical protein
MTEFDPTPIDTPPLGLPQRLVGTLFSPRPTYASVARHPRWLGVLAVSALAMALGQYAFLSTPRGQQAMQAAAVTQIRTLQRAGLPIPAEAVQQARKSTVSPVGTAAYVAVVIPVSAAILAGLLIGWFNTIGGGEARYRQVFAIVAHSSLIWCVAGVVAWVVGYFKGEVVNAAGSLSGLLPMLDEEGFPARFLGFIDLFWIWGLVNLAIGIAVLYQRRTGGIAMSLVSIYLVVGLVYAIARSSLGV